MLFPPTFPFTLMTAAAPPSPSPAQSSTPPSHSPAVALPNVGMKTKRQYLPKQQGVFAKGGWCTPVPQLRPPVTRDLPRETHPRSAGSAPLLVPCLLELPHTGSRSSLAAKGSRRALVMRDSLRAPVHRAADEGLPSVWGACSRGTESQRLQELRASGSLWVAAL